MATIVPQGELIRKAVSWIGEEAEERKIDPVSLVDEAAMRYNISPNDAEFLRRFMAGEEKEEE